MASVFVCGVAVIDFVQFVQNFPQGGLKHRSLSCEISGGGIGANAAVAIQRLGGDADLGCRLGTDLIGDLILADLQQEGVGTKFVTRTTDARSPLSSVIVNEVGERQVLSYAGAGLPDEVDWLSDIPYADAFLTDCNWSQGIEHSISQARRYDVPVVIDVERGSFPEHLWQATHLAFSRQGILALTGESTIPEALKALASVRTNWLCATDGENGVFRMSHGRLDQIPAHVIEAKNTLGAGDVWHGAFALRLAEGANEDDAIQFANAAAAVCCSRIESRSSFPYRGEIGEYLNGSL